MRRRTILASLTALAAGTAVAPAVSLEAARHGIATAAGGPPGGVEWDGIVAGYTRDFSTTPPDEIVDDVAADLVVLQQMLIVDPDSRDLRRAGAQLGVIMALALGSAGRHRQARRWWITAQQAADRSGCNETGELVRGSAVVRGLYERRPTNELMTVAARPVSRPCFGAAEQLAGRAQLHAHLGQRDEARQSLEQLRDLYEQLPESVSGNDGIFGWREYRYHHTASYIATHLRNTAAAYAAQDQALALYPPGLERQAVMVRLHRARCLIIDGSVSDGLNEAASALDVLPAPHRGGPLSELASAVLAEVPAGERGRSEFGELRDRLPVAL